MPILALAGKPDHVQIAAILRGLPSTTLGEISRTLGLSRETIIAALKLSRRKISACERSGDRFGPEESERLLRVIRVRHLVREVFVSDTAVVEWMCSPQDYLDGQTPLEALDTGLGAARVENLARSMIHGVLV